MEGNKSALALKIRKQWINSIVNLKKDYEKYGHKQWILKPIYPARIDLWNEILGIANIYVEEKSKPYILCKTDSSFEKQLNHLRRSISHPVNVVIINSGEYNFINVYVPPN